MSIATLSKTWISESIRPQPFRAAQVEVADGRIVAVHPCKAVPTSLLSADLLAEIRQQEQRLAQGKGLSLPEAMREIENKKREDREKRAASGKRGKVEFGTGATEKLHG